MMLVIPHPICPDGKRACPPEDCGGPWGYEEMLEDLADPRHAEHKERLEWLGGEFDPAAFDQARVNLGLRKLQRANRKRTTLFSATPAF